jgi:hypothetical protein
MKRYAVEINFHLREIHNECECIGSTYASSDTKKGLIRNIKRNYGRIGEEAGYSGYYEVKSPQIIWISEEQFDLPKLF